MIPLSRATKGSAPSAPEWPAKGDWVRYPTGKAKKKTQPVGLVIAVNGAAVTIRTASGNTVTRHCANLTKAEKPKTLKLYGP